MLKRLPIALIVLLGTLSCNNEQFEQCKAENDILIAEKARRDSVIRHMSQTYASIDSTSFVISKKKALIGQLAQKKPLTQEDKDIILAEMDTINTLIEENKSNVSKLRDENAGNGIEEAFVYMMNNMDEKNEEENAGLENVKKDLAQVSQDFSELFEEYVYKEVENLEMRDQLSTTEAELQEAQAKLNEAKEKLRSGYYIIGTREELREKGLIYKKGIFDIKEVNEDFDRSLFRKVDIYEFKEILLDKRSAEIMTTHPSESYEIKGIKKKVDKLVIKNPELFWSVSKFLIIEIDK